jgi:hypothetical protein
MALAPLIIGWIADHSSLLWAMHAAIVAQTMGGILFVFVIYLIRRQGLHHESLAGYLVEGIATASESAES